MGRKADGQADLQDKKSAKFFDKKAYRFKKYNSKYKLDKWEDSRRKEVIKSYYKEMKKDPLAGKYKPFNFDDGNAKIGSDVDSEEDDIGVTNVDSKANRFCYVLHPDRMKNGEEKASEDVKKNDKSGGVGNKMNTFLKVKEEMGRLKEEKRKQKEEALKAKAEREQALVKYKRNKADKFKKLSKKSKSGQPVMQDRMQMLLDAIQRKTK